MDDGSRDKLRGRFVLFQQAIHHFLVFVGNFGVAAELVVAGPASEVGPFGMHAGQGARRDLIFVFAGVALEFGQLFDFFQAQDAAAIGLISVVPFEARDHPIVHADVEIGHQKDRRLEALGQIESDRREFEALGRIRRKQQNMFRVAVRRVGAFEQIALLGARRHAGGRAQRVRHR